MVAPVDTKSAKYATSIRTLEPRLGTVADLEDMVVELLRAFFATTMKKPERILFYRNGVLEGLFVQVHRDEVVDIRSVCKKLHVTYVPEITSVIVLKRHYARLFPMQKDQADRSGNCPPGTVVNTDIIHPFESGFHMQSHTGLIRTSRYAHYNILCNENRSTLGSLHELTV